ncbi:hypothetical protein [Geminisphaera colitermitum]|uniref:hypothetical protein n=1 Tax=Geminisphaera colitermitum TaxID=1148786 RepID=UPI0002D3B25C|nr:hypothetical protein [Geminisphaera colitermitum]
MPAPEHRMHIAAGRYAVTHADGSRDEGRIDIMAGTMAHEADIVCETGAGAGRTLRAILRCRGNLLQLCYHAEENAGRPSTFATGRGSLAVLVRYRRVTE